MSKQAICQVARIRRGEVLTTFERHTANLADKRYVSQHAVRIPEALPASSTQQNRLAQNATKAAMTSASDPVAKQPIAKTGALVRIVRAQAQDAQADRAIFTQL